MPVHLNAVMTPAAYIEQIRQCAAQRRALDPEIIDGFSQLPNRTVKLILEDSGIRDTLFHNPEGIERTRLSYYVERKFHGQSSQPSAAAFLGMLRAQWSKLIENANGWVQRRLNHIWLVKLMPMKLRQKLPAKLAGTYWAGGEKGPQAGKLYASEDVIAFWLLSEQNGPHTNSRLSRGFLSVDGVDEYGDVNATLSNVATYNFSLTPAAAATDDILSAMDSVAYESGLSLVERIEMAFLTGDPGGISVPTPCPWLSLHEQDCYFDPAAMQLPAFQESVLNAWNAYFRLPNRELLDSTFKFHAGTSMESTWADIPASIHGAHGTDSYDHLKMLIGDQQLTSFCEQIWRKLVHRLDNGNWAIPTNCATAVQQENQVGYFFEFTPKMLCRPKYVAGSLVDQERPAVFMIEV